MQQCVLQLSRDQVSLIVMKSCLEEGRWAISAFIMGSFAILYVCVGGTILDWRLKLCDMCRKSGKGLMHGTGETIHKLGMIFSQSGIL